MLLCFCEVQGSAIQREGLLLNVTVFVERVWGGQYREELILNVTEFFVRVWGGNIERNRY